MMKRILFTCLFAGLVGAANAADFTAPVLTGMRPCESRYAGEPKEVKLTYRVTETGTVEDIKLAQSSGDPGADEAAMKCVATWTYKPAMKDGVAVAHQLVFVYHWARTEDLSGNAKAFSALERDVTRRCNKLFPVKRSLLNLNQAITLVTVARLASGEVQTQVTQSAGEKADRQAVACVTALVKDPDHADLPAVFVRVLGVNWALMR